MSTILHTPLLVKGGLTHLNEKIDTTLISVNSFSLSQRVGTRESIQSSVIKRLYLI